MLGFVNKLFISVQLIVFFDHVLLPAELAQKFKLLQNSCMAKWFHETELQGIYIRQKNWIRLFVGLKKHYILVWPLNLMFYLSLKRSELKIWFSFFKDGLKLQVPFWDFPTFKSVFDLFFRIITVLADRFLELLP